MNVRDVLKAEERSLGQYVRVLDHARLDPDVLVVTYETKTTAPEFPGQTMVTRRCVAYAGDRQLYSAIVATKWEGPTRES